MRKIYKNIPEENFCRFIEDLGFTPTKRGWPDFICINPDGKFIIVEVKDTKTHPLKKEQLAIMKILAGAGIPTYRWDNQNKTLQEINQFSQRKLDQTGKS